MTEELKKLVKAAAKKFADKRAPKNPETQFARVPNGCTTF